MVRKVSSKLWNTCLVVVSVLGVELYVAVAVQKHQLQSYDEKEMVNLKSMCLQKRKETKNFMEFGLTYVEISEH